MNKIYLLIVAGVLLVTAVGCGTVKGIGEDITTVGHWFTRGSNRASE